MDKIYFNSLTQEQIELASRCETAEELIELAKKAGVELDEADLDKIAGGRGVCYSHEGCSMHDL